MSRQPAPRVVIVGGGFGGLYAASYLAQSELGESGAEITLIDARNYFTFTPLLSEVVTGTLGREHVTYPYRSLAHRRRFAFLHDTALRIDLTRRQVETRRVSVPFDYLVIAVGSAPRYFGQAGVERHGLPLTSVQDALTIRSRVIGSLERALLLRRDAATRTRLLTFVVAGAGPAGVEVASGIHELATCQLRPYYGDLPVRIILATAGEGILQGFDERLARDGLEILRRRGIDVRLETRIVDAGAEFVTMEHAGRTERVGTETLVWTAGMTPPAWVSEQFPADGRSVRVDRCLQVEGCEGVFAIGDLAAARDHRGERYPQVAPIAISQGIRAAANIENVAFGREPETYQAFHAGKIVSLGGGVALVDLLGFRISGWPAWWIYRLAYLFKLVGMKNKARVLTTLILNRLFEPDMSYEESVERPAA